MLTCPLQDMPRIETQRSALLRQTFVPTNQSNKPLLQRWSCRATHKTCMRAIAALHYIINYQWHHTLHHQLPITSHITSSPTRSTKNATFCLTFFMKTNKMQGNRDETSTPNSITSKVEPLHLNRSKTIIGMHVS